MTQETQSVLKSEPTLKYNGIGKGTFFISVTATFALGMALGYMFWGNDAETAKYNKKHGYS